MSQQRSTVFDRAVKIEMLRAKAALERRAIGAQTTRLCQSLDPREQIANFLPRSASGVMGQVSKLLVRYPFLLSGGASLVSTHLLRPKRLLMVGAAGLAVWLLGRQGRSDE